MAGRAWPPLAPHFRRARAVGPARILIKHARRPWLADWRPTTSPHAKALPLTIKHHVCPPSRHDPPARPQHIDGRQIDGAPAAHEPARAGAHQLARQLGLLLDQLDRIQATGRQLDSDEQQLLEALRCRLLGPPPPPPAAAEPGGVAEPQHQRPSQRANLMRYSTPNLLLASNFEHLLRQRDRVSTH